MSIPNLIRQKRKAFGLSQRALADSIGTSQQQIQRIEAGVQTARLDLAVSIAEALKSSLSEIFPSLTSDTARGGRRRKRDRVEPFPIVAERLLEVGIDADLSYWTIKFGFAADGSSFILFHQRTKTEFNR